MSKRPFYASLAWTNIKNNRRFYIPYILTGVGTVAMFYIILFTALNNGMEQVYGSGTLTAFLILGAVIIAIFSTIFLFYTNSFLMKRRKKELGLFTVLGMEKRHLARIQLYETVIVAILSVVLGLCGGILFSKLVMLVLSKMVHFDIQLGFSINWLAALISLIVFAIIFTITLISNLVRIGRLKPVELLYGGNMGQKEPKTKWLLAIFGAICLLSGYAIAIFTQNPVSAVFLFFIAVILVIIGTYCLFTAGSIAVLKILRSNKRYYYTTKHFTSVSGMLYRMRQNATGLGNICILSTMVLVMLSSTIALNTGMQDVLNKRYPNDVRITLFNTVEDTQGNPVSEFSSAMSERMQRAETLIREAADSKGRELTSLNNCTMLGFAVVPEPGNFNTNGQDNYFTNDASELLIITDGEYNRLTGESVALNPGEVLLNQNEASVDVGSSFTLFDKTYTVVGDTGDFRVNGESNIMLVGQYTVVVDSDETLSEIEQAELAAYEYGNHIRGVISVSMDGKDSEKLECYHEMLRLLSLPYGEGNDGERLYDSINSECRVEAAGDFYSLYGGLLFIGTFLGLLFLMATILIMYYKQVTEGYDDKERFRIMQQVGMSSAEVRQSIRSQVLTVFFLPLVTAFIHILFAFSIISKLLAVLNLTNVSLYLLSTIITVLVFAVLYTIVYAVTARVYYKIVEMK